MTGQQSMHTLIESTSSPEKFNGYLGWYDDSKNVPEIVKLKDGIERYIEKWGAKPNIVLVNPEAQLPEALSALLTVRREQFVRPNHYWIGRSVETEEKGGEN